MKYKIYYFIFHQKWFLGKERSDKIIPLQRIFKSIFSGSWNKHSNHWNIGYFKKCRWMNKNVLYSLCLSFSSHSSSPPFLPPSKQFKGSKITSYHAISWQCREPRFCLVLSTKYQVTIKMFAALQCFSV